MFEFICDKNFNPELENELFQHKVLNFLVIGFVLFNTSTKLYSYFFKRFRNEESKDDSSSESSLSTTFSGKKPESVSSSLSDEEYKEEYIKNYINGLKSEDNKVIEDIIYESTIKEI